MPLNFTLRHKERVNDVDDPTGDVQLVIGVGALLFTPTFTPGARIPYGVDIGIATRGFPAYLDTDGELKSAAGETAGLRLWANDPDFNIDRFQYRVSAPGGLTDFFGRPVPFQEFNFDAPSVDTTWYLKDLVPPPGQKFGRGRPAWPLVGGSVAAGVLTLQNGDGSTLSGITLPTGTLVDNGDGTISIVPS